MAALLTTGAKNSKSYTRDIFSGQRGEQLADFVLDIFGCVHGASDLFAHQLAKSAAQTVGGHLDRPFGHPQRLRHLSVRQGGVLTHQENAEMIEESAFV